MQWVSRSKEASSFLGWHSLGFLSYKQIGFRLALLRKMQNEGQKQLLLLAWSTCRRLEGCWEAPGSFKGGRLAQARCGSHRIPPLLFLFPSLKRGREVTTTTSTVGTLVQTTAAPARTVVNNPFRWSSGFPRAVLFEAQQPEVKVRVYHFLKGRFLLYPE